MTELFARSQGSPEIASTPAAPPGREPAQPVKPSIVGLSLLSEVEPSSATEAGPTQPRTAVEQALVDIWRQVLPARVVLPGASLFEIGGDSLLATQIAARVRQVFGIELDLIDLFDEPTLAGMAERIEASLRQHASIGTPPLTTAPRTGPRPLSFTQERMWFIQQLDPLSAAYNIAGAVRLHGPFDLAALEAALNELARRHESLRTVFRSVDGEPRQWALPPAQLCVPVIDLSGVAQAERLARATALAEQFAHEPFDLATGPLLRAAAIRLGADDQLLLLSVHHIVSDAWSMAVLGRELMALYHTSRARETAGLPDLPIQYADFAVWQRAVLEGPALEPLLAYWREQLHGVSPLALPLDHPRPRTQTYVGAVQADDLDPSVLGALRSLCQPAGATLSMALLAAFNILLQRYCGQDNIAVGMSIANRRYLAVEGLIGAFVNTLVLRTDLSGEPSFLEVLRRVRTAALGAYAHQDMPFAKLVAELNPERSLSRSPLVQVMFNHINVPMPAQRLDDLTADYFELDRGAAQFDLTLTVVDLPGRQRLIIEYNTDLFEAATIVRLARHYQNLLRACAEHSAQAVTTLDLLDEAERRQLLQTWNQTRRPYPVKSLSELFEDQVARTPASQALRAGAETLTYSALNRRANQIAHHMCSLGARAGVRIALCLPRSFDQIAVLLAILKTGAACVPLDPTYPQGRLRFVLTDSQAVILVTERPYVDLLGELPEGLGLLVLDAQDQGVEHASDKDLDVFVSIDAPAYLTYTSGSTGKPKGVVAPHRGAVNRCAWMWTTYPFAPGEVACNRTSLSFVDAIAEIFTPLLSGVPLVLVPEVVARTPRSLIDTLSEHGVTRVGLFPSLLRAILATGENLPARLPQLTPWMAASEVLDRPLVCAFQNALPGATLINLCGSSEDGGDVLYFDCRQPMPEDSVPIGRPIFNTQIYLMDARQRIVPVGIAGEIYVGGDGLALGYHSRPDLTDQRFLPDPFHPEPGQRLFRTGDLARYLPDGNLLYLGRRDRQVKLRGMRIELDEIQVELRSHPALAACAVALRERPADDGPHPELVAYYVVRPETAVATRDLRRHLTDRLPISMVPARFVELAALPVLPNGKVDEAALPTPNAVDESGAPLVAPRTLLKNSLARLWAEALGVPAVGITDNFFELGGHSLLAASLFERMRSVLGIALPITTLFRSPTIAEIAVAIECTGQAPGRLTSLVPLKPSGIRPPLFCVHPLGGGAGGYAVLARRLRPEQPLYGLNAKGLDDSAQQKVSVEAMAADYISEISSLQPNGPYRLGGYSSGGLVAYEMACQLTQSGESVGLVALLDSYAPASGQWSLSALIHVLLSIPLWLVDLSKLRRVEVLERARRWLLIARRGPQAVTAIDFLGQSAMGQMLPLQRSFVEAHYQAIQAYRPRPYPGQVTLFRAQTKALSRAADPDKGWRQLAQGGVDIREVHGSHHNLLLESNADELARVLQARLDEIG